MYFNTPLRTISLREKINKELLGLQNSLDKMDTSGIYKAFHPTEAEKYFCQEHKEYYEG